VVSDSGWYNDVIILDIYVCVVIYHLSRSAILMSTSAKMMREFESQKSRVWDLGQECMSPLFLMKFRIPGRS